MFCNLDTYFTYTKKLRLQKPKAISDILFGYVVALVEATGLFKKPWDVKLGPESDYTAVIQVMCKSASRRGS